MTITEEQRQARARFDVFEQWAAVHVKGPWFLARINPWAHLAAAVWLVPGMVHALPVRLREMDWHLEPDEMRI